MLTESYKILDSLRLEHGLYRASTSADYKYVWIRDSLYCSLPYLDKSCDKYERAFYRLFDLFREYGDKIDYHTRVKPQESWQYIHSRYHAEDVREITHEPWGHNQLDAIGAFLFGVGSGLAQGKRMFRSYEDVNVILKLIAYLACVEYWHCADNGMWEEDTEVHASSVGACVAGLIAVGKYVSVPLDLIERGAAALAALGDRESAGKDVDLAQLSLIYPYNIVAHDVAERIIAKVEAKLLRSRGVIRYEGDSYYSTLEAEHGRGYPKEFYYGGEAEWTFGLPWMALCCDGDKARKYVRRTEEVALEGGALPELYYAGTAIAGPNSPLGWSSAMYILAKEKAAKPQCSEETAQRLNVLVSK